MDALMYASLESHSKKADLRAVDNDGDSVLDLYGLRADPPLSDEIKKQRRESIRIAWAEGPHISQVHRRDWEHCYPLIVVMTAFHNQPGWPSDLWPIDRC